MRFTLNSIKTGETRLLRSVLSFVITEFDGFRLSIKKHKTFKNANGLKFRNTYVCDVEKNKNAAL